MGVLSDTEEQEKAKAEAIIASTPQFAGIESVHIELGDDNSGDPAMWLVFRIRPGVIADEPWIQAFSEYSTKLGLKLIHSGLTRFPYTRLEPAA
jgi:hypothetical protein